MLKIFFLLILSGLFNSRHGVSIENAYKIADYLDKVMDKRLENIYNVKKEIQNFRDRKNISLSNYEQLVANPVSYFLYVKNETKDLDNFLKSINDLTHTNDLQTDINEKFDSPSKTAYRETVRALIKLGDVYAIQPMHFNSGNILKAYSTEKLKALDYFEIGKFAYYEKDYYHAAIWLDEALTLYQNERSSSSLNLTSILNYLSSSLKSQGNNQHQVEAIKNWEKIEIIIKKLASKLKVDESVVMEAYELNDIINPRPPISEMTLVYESLCRNDELVFNEPKINKLLKCRYLNNKPDLIIAPVKEEKIFFDPPIWVFHDVITEKQIQSLKKSAFSKLERSTVVGANFTRRIHEGRTSKSAFLSNVDFPEHNYLTNLINSVTNLSMTVVDDWQIAKYGIGEYFEPHLDSFDANENGINPFRGNRIATWMFYLDDPIVGGATVFPEIRARVEPKRKSAVFWYNLNTSGERDFRTWHAGCPVLIGEKYVSNKWIYSKGQELIRKCLPQ